MVAVHGTYYTVEVRRLVTYIRPSRSFGLIIIGTVLTLNMSAMVYRSG